MHTMSAVFMFACMCVCVCSSARVMYYIKLMYKQRKDTGCARTASKPYNSVRHTKLAASAHPKTEKVKSFIIIRTDAVRFGRRALLCYVCASRMASMGCRVSDKTFWDRSGGASALCPGVYYINRLLYAHTHGPVRHCWGCELGTTWNTHARIFI